MLKKTTPENLLPINRQRLKNCFNYNTLPYTLKPLLIDRQQT